MKPQAIFAVDHNPIGPHVDPAFFGIPRYDEVVGADIAAAVQLVPTGYRETQDIHIRSLQPVFEQGSAGDPLRLYRVDLFDFAAPPLDELQLAQMGLQAHGQGVAIDG